MMVFNVNGRAKIRGLAKQPIRLMTSILHDIICTMIP